MPEALEYVWRGYGDGEQVNASDAVLLIAFAGNREPSRVKSPTLNPAKTRFRVGPSSDGEIRVRQDGSTRAAPV